MSKAKRFISRLKTELLPPRHPSAVIGKSTDLILAIPQNQEAKNNQIISLLNLFAHVEMIEKKAKNDLLSDDEPEPPKLKETSVDLQTLLEDDEIMQDDPTKNAAQAEDDVSEKSSHDDTESEKSFGDVLLHRTGLLNIPAGIDIENFGSKHAPTSLIVDPDEKAAMRASSLRKKNKRARVERVTVDPDWLKEFVKRRKIAEDDEQYVGDSQEEKNNGDTQSMQIKFYDFEEKIKNSTLPLEPTAATQLMKLLLVDYLNHIKGLTGKLKMDMYKMVINMIHNTTLDNYPNLVDCEKIDISELEEEIINFIINNDRHSFFDVMKFWVHSEFNQKCINNCQKFDILFPHILKKILSHKLFTLPKKWISFMETLPVFNQNVFRHIYQVGFESIHKEVAAIKLCSKMLLSRHHKVSIKED